MPAVLNKKESPKPTLAPRPSVDFPRQNEVIDSPFYTLRVTTPEQALKVEVSIDQGEWQACRESLGHWWYDWSGYGNGEHELIARFETGQGRAQNSEPTEFFVELQPETAQD